MVKAELIYNPYLLETIVRFNGQEPRINSLVEKYQDQPLQYWINMVPQIFYDEMNGYDFELEFSGTRTDFEELKRSFIHAGVTEEEVKIFLKNESYDRKTMHEKVTEVLEWLKTNPNDRFDCDGFNRRNHDLLEESYPLIVLHSKNVELFSLEDTVFSPERIDSVRELDQTNLTNTPIVICVSKKTKNQLIADIEYMQKRHDVMETQLFFFISKELEESSTVRMIRDLGIKRPEIVSSLKDDAITKYFELYPQCNFDS